MIYTEKTLVTKSCPNCPNGREVVYFFMDKYTKDQAAEEFRKSPEYEHGRDYLIYGDPNSSLVWHVVTLI